MTPSVSQLTKDITNVDVADILSSWRWKIGSISSVAAISVLGDLFLIGNDAAIYWLQADGGEMTKVADDLQQFQKYLEDQDKIDNWFLPLLVEKLVESGKTLKENEVYSFKQLPCIGGDYSIDNFETTDISVHFAITGQISEKIKDLPDKTKLNIRLEL